jgi:hypothetical protein
MTLHFVIIILSYCIISLHHYTTLSLTALQPVHVRPYVLQTTTVHVRPYIISNCTNLILPNCTSVLTNLQALLVPGRKLHNPPPPPSPPYYCLAHSLTFVNSHHSQLTSSYISQPLLHYSTTALLQDAAQ